ncbi:MAG: hypothetical protein U0636_05680 [Phycisphaerales bacterium]
MSQQTTPQDISKILAQAGPYPLAAYQFVQEGLRHRGAGRTTTQMQRRVPAGTSGQQLCLGLRDYAIDQYGLLAPVVLASWHDRTGGLWAHGVCAH